MTVTQPTDPTVAEEIRQEQLYFDRAWTAREASRRSLADAPAAVSGKASVAMRRTASKYLDQMGDADEAVAIGRFDPLDGPALYVGKHLISDGENEPLVISWKADAAAPFFTASPEDPQGLARKRTYDLDRNTILSFDDMVFADLLARVEELTALQEQGIDDAVLRDLEAGRTTEMRDIVRTIHALQYDLVRAPLEQLLVVQGGPGTGKTVVALHRVSWLLFNHPDDLPPEAVLVVGPNPTFTRYIRSVLPGLGDSDVEHRDLRTLGPQPSTGREESAQVARLKGDARMARLLTMAMVARIRFPERATRLEVGPASEPFAVLERDEVVASLGRAANRMPNYAAGRARMRSWLASTATSRARWGIDIPAAAIDAALERVWPSLSPQAFLRDLLGSRDRLLAAATAAEAGAQGGGSFTAAEVDQLFRAAADRIAEERWTDADVALLDEADWLINGATATFGHIVVDEAQDLSPMQLRSVRRRSRTGSYTLVGDLAQSTGAWARDSWDAVTEALQLQHPVAVVQLSLGYRVPQQVFAVAAQLLPHAAPGVEVPQVVRHGPSDPEYSQVESEDIGIEAVRAAGAYASRGLFVGVVCPDAFRAAVVRALETADIQYKDARSGSLGAGINLVSPTDAKGLEFDAVVVVEPEAIVRESSHGLRLLYVALTRTTKHLTVVHHGPALPLPDVGEPGALPGLAVTSLQNPTTALTARPTKSRPVVEQLPGLVLDGELDLRTTPDLPAGTGRRRDRPHGAPRVVRMLATDLAEEIAESVNEPLWDAVIEALAAELARRRRE